MRLIIAAVGRLRSGPEAALVEDYLDRFVRVGRGIGLPTPEMIEVEDRRGGGPAAEAALLRRAIPAGAALITLDERGELIDSRELARRIARARDLARDLSFVIGGANGIDPALRTGADWALSLGPMVWPHQLARVMLAEQFYRSATILAGLPYHRD